MLISAIKIHFWLDVSEKGADQSEPGGASVCQIRDAYLPILDNDPPETMACGHENLTILPVFVKEQGFFLLLPA